MQPSGSEFELPVEAEKKQPPSVEAGPVPEIIEHQRNPELGSADETDSHSGAGAVQPPADVASNLAQTIAVPATVQPPAAAATAATAVADDVDLIEKTWVERAKSIIASTKDDPYAQKTEISKVKAEYIQKRYNKKIKLADDSVKK